MAPSAAERGGFLADLRRRAAEAAAAAADKLDVASATATESQLEVDTVLLGGMRQTLREPLEGRPIEDTPEVTDVREEALGQVTRAVDVAREPETAVVTRVHNRPVRCAAADSLEDRARVVAEAAALSAAGRPDFAASPERQRPAGSALPSKLPQTGPRPRLQSKSCSCHEAWHQKRSHCAECDVQGHQRADCEALVEEHTVHAARVERRQTETMSAREKVATGVPRASSAKQPRGRALRATGRIVRSRAFPKSTRVARAATSYSGDTGVNALAPDPCVLGQHLLYRETLVPLRVPFERHLLPRGRRPRRTPVEAGRPPPRERETRGRAGTAAARERLPRKLEKVAAAGNKHTMLMIEALEGTVRSPRAATNGIVRTFMDAIPVDDLTEEVTCAWNWMAAVTSREFAYQRGRSADTRVSGLCEPDHQR